MMEGGGAGELADQIASEGLEREDGTLRTLVSAEHIGTQELPDRTIHVVSYETGKEGDTLPCLAIGEESDPSSVRHTCGTGLPENIGVVVFDTSGPLEVLIMKVSTETETVMATTSRGERFTARPASQVAYLEWPMSAGRGSQVVGLGADGQVLWTRILPGG